MPGFEAVLSAEYAAAAAAWQPHSTSAEEGEEEGCGRHESRSNPRNRVEITIYGRI